MSLIRVGGALLQAHLPHVFLGLMIGAVPVNAEFAPALIAQEHIFSDGQLWDQCQLLMDDDDTLLLAVLQSLKLAFLTVIDDVAGIASEGIDAAQHVHQSDLPAPFSPTRAWISPALHFQIDVIQCLDTGNSFVMFFITRMLSAKFNASSFLPSGPGRNWRRSFQAYRPDKRRAGIPF